MIKVGDSVEVQDPKENDHWDYPFVGIVIAIKDKFLVVEDQEGNCWDVEPENVKLTGEENE